MTSAAAISVTALSKTYVEGIFRRRRREVLKPLSLDVHPGEIFGLLGPNGAGKTTFIKILLGIVRRTSGDARLLGFNAGDRRGRRLVGYLPENLRVARHHNANSALDYYGQLSGMSRREVLARRESLLQTVGLADRAKDSVAKYSKGMLQRLGLAQALLHDPQLVILDEPTDGLDPVGRSHVRNIMLQLKQQGKTVFVNSHILQEVELVCDRVAILDQGHLRFVGPVKELTTSRASVAQPEGGMVPSEMEVQLEVLGSEAGILAILDGRPVLAWERLAENHQRVLLQLSTQENVDGLVDQLRTRGISILGLARRKVSLEDAFLAMVEQ